MPEPLGVLGRRGVGGHRLGRHPAVDEVGPAVLLQPRGGGRVHARGGALLGRLHHLGGPATLHQVPQRVPVEVPGWVPDGPTSVRGDGPVARAQTNAFVVEGGDLTAAEAGTPMETATPATDGTPIGTETESPTATVEVPTETPIAETATPEPTATETPTVELTPTDTPPGTPVDEVPGEGTPEFTTEM